MSEITADPIVSPNSRAELREIAAALGISDVAARRAYFSIHGEEVSGKVKAEPVRISVSAETRRHLARLIIGTDAPKVARTARTRREMTTQEAADMLGVSRPYLIKLLDSGRIPYRMVGRYRRIRRDDVERFEREEQEKRRAGLEELADLTQSIGLEY